MNAIAADSVKTGERALVVVPAGPEQSAACAALRTAGLTAESADVAELLRAAGHPVVAVVAADALNAAARESLRAAGQKHRNGRGFVLILLAGPQQAHAAWSWLAACKGPGYAAVLQRPVREETLAGAVQVALRVSRAPAAETRAAGPVVAELRALNESLEQAVAQRTAMLTLLHDIASAANSARTFEDAVAFAVQRISAQFQCAFAQALVPTEDEPEILSPTSVFAEQVPGRFDRFRAATREARITAGADLLGRSLRTRSPARTDDPARDLLPARAALARELGLRAGVAFPILVGHEVVAVLEFYLERPMAFDERLLDAVASVGTQLGRVSERQHAERILRRTERLAAMGTFAAGIAHEVNNPLSSILMTARHALKREPDRAALNGLLQEIVEDTERCARIVRDVLRFAREDRGERQPVRINELVERVLHLTQRRAEQAPDSYGLSGRPGPADRDGEPDANRAGAGGHRQQRDSGQPRPDSPS